MAHDKAKGHKGLTQKHLHSRISYLYQAATYLANPAGIYQNIHNRGKIQVPRPEEELGSGTADCTSVPKGCQTMEASDSEVEKFPLQVKDATCARNVAMSQQLLGHLRTVSRKSQVRISQNMKHTMCKRCNLLLIPGSTSTTFIENKSCSGIKAWADVLVITCDACGTARRFPVGANRQLKRDSRTSEVR